MVAAVATTPTVHYSALAAEIISTYATIVTDSGLERITGVVQSLGCVQESSFAATSVTPGAEEASESGDGVTAEESNESSAEAVAGDKPTITEAVAKATT